MLSFILSLILISLTAADDPIIQLLPGCPPDVAGSPNLLMIADVPAYGMAKCKNGHKIFGSHNGVHYKLKATFESAYKGPDCQFYKKNGTQTYVVEIEVGWGDRDSPIINQKDAKSISCSYDDHGSASSAAETVVEWFLNPAEVQSLLGSASSAVFELRVVDVLGRPIPFADHISIGRKVRLMAHDSTDIRCGDGIVFGKQEGFITAGCQVISPFFDAFKLRGSNDIQFQCAFTACPSGCDGNSCETESKRKRRATRIQSKSRPIRTA